MRQIARCGLLLGSCAVLLAGCGTSDSPPQGNSETKAQASDSPASLPAKSATPAEVVRQFLTAVKVADDHIAESLLTNLAREKTAEMEIEVAPPGSDTASFEIGQVAFVSNSEAHVASYWTELDEQGQPRTDEIIWDLRASDQGWRIAGMATVVFEGDPPLYLNFEDPADMMQKQRLVEQEFERRSGTIPPQGSNPATQGQAVVPPAGQYGPSGRDVPNDRTAAKIQPDGRELPQQRLDSGQRLPPARGNNTPQGRFEP